MNLHFYKWNIFNANRRVMVSINASNVEIPLAVHKSCWSTDHCWPCIAYLCVCKFKYRNQFYQCSIMHLSQEIFLTLQHETRKSFWFLLLLDKTFQKSYLTISSVFWIALKHGCLQNSNIFSTVIFNIIVYHKNYELYRLGWSSSVRKKSPTLEILW